MPSKYYYLPDYFWITTDYFGSFIPFLLKRLYRADTSPNHWLSFSTKTIFDQYQIAYPTARPKDYLAPFQARLPLPLPAARSGTSPSPAPAPIEIVSKISIISYAVPAPIFKSHFQKVTLVPFPDTSVNLRCPAPQLQKFTKVLLVPFPTPIITYAIQHPKLYIQKYCWHHSQCQWYLTLTSALLKILPKKYHWYHS